MYQILLVVQILVAISLIALVLLQQGRGADAGAAFGSGSSGSVFGSRGPASFLAKLTALLAAVFFFNSIALAYITTQSVDRGSVVERFQDEVPGFGGSETGQSEPEDGAAKDVPSGVAGDSPGAVSDVPTSPPASDPQQEN